MNSYNLAQFTITAKIDGVAYSIILDKNAMNPNSQYAGKVSVYLILSGLESAETIKSYVDELTEDGFTFDSVPNLENNHIEFLTFKDGSMINFAYFEKGACFWIRCLY